jgi:hypothetical protein
VQILLTLRSSNEIMMAQKDLLKAGIRISIIGMPRDISHECGVAIAFSDADLERVRTVIGEHVYGNAEFFRHGENCYEKIHGESHGA